jgi:hypothetical protein
MFHLLFSVSNPAYLFESGHPMINSRYILHEAQQAHHFSLPPHLALASVTSVPATTAGLSHRIGILYEGADADVVLWDSHPLRLGATPVNVWIDGIMQIPVPSKMGGEGKAVIGKDKEGPEWRKVPEVPNWDIEREKAVQWEGLPPLDGRKEIGKVVFRNVKEVWTRGKDGAIEEAFSASSELGRGMATVVVENGKIVCVGSAETCTESTDASDDVDLHAGSISPGLMSYGSPLGLEEIAGEPSTGGGELYNAFTENLPNILNDVAGVVRAMDALMFGTRNALSVALFTVYLLVSNNNVCPIEPPTVQESHRERHPWQSPVVQVLESSLVSRLPSAQAPHMQWNGEP